MEKKKGKELKKGDIVNGEGLILDVELDSDPDGFWNGKPNYKYLSLHDSYHGALCGELKVDNEFEVITERETVIDILKRIDSDLAKCIADMLQQRKEFGEIREDIVNKLNKKMRQEREKEKIQNQ